MNNFIAAIGSLGVASKGQSMADHQDGGNDDRKWDVQVLAH